MCLFFCIRSDSVMHKITALFTNNHTAVFEHIKMLRYCTGSDFQQVSNRTGAQTPAAKKRYDLCSRFYSKCLENGYIWIVHSFFILVVTKIDCDEFLCKSPTSGHGYRLSWSPSAHAPRDSFLQL